MLKTALTRYWFVAAAIPMMGLLAGCQVNDNRADDQMPIWYPAFIYHAPSPDVNQAGVNGGSNDNNSNTTTTPTGVDSTDNG